MNQSSDCQHLDDYLNATLEQSAKAKFIAHLPQCCSCTEEIAIWDCITDGLQHSFRSLTLNENESIKLVKVANTEPEASRSLRWAVAIAASALLAVTAIVSWLLSHSSNQSTNINTVAQGEVATESSAETTASTPIFANAEFDEQTIAVLECDEDELTFYRVFPKVTIRSSE